MAPQSARPSSPNLNTRIGMNKAHCIEYIFKVTVIVEKPYGEPIEYVMYCKTMELATRTVNHFYSSENKEDCTGFSASIEREEVITE